MSYTVVRKLPTASEMVNSYPLSSQGEENIRRHRQEIRNILAGKDQRLIMIVGPCSAWPYDAVLEYADKLVELDKQLSHKLKIVMRAYIQKPRTVKGWTGPATQPNPLLPANIEHGMHYARKLMVEIANKNLAIADEALFTHNARSYIDLLSWVAIGARSSEDQEHRIFASAIDCPVGMKNPTSGSIQIGINGVVAAQHSHVAAFDNEEVQTSGNLFAHLVLRGGNDAPNYSLADLEYAHTQLTKAAVANPAVIVDVSHDNCRIHGIKDYRQQGTIIFEVLESIQNKPQLKQLVKGFMLESFLQGGRQDIAINQPIDMHGLSITDACLSFEETQQLLIDLARY